MVHALLCWWLFFFNDTATTEIYTLSLHDALPIYFFLSTSSVCMIAIWPVGPPKLMRSEEHTSELQSPCNLVCRLLLETKKHPTRFQSPCNLVCRVGADRDGARAPRVRGRPIKRSLGGRRGDEYAVRLFFFFFNDTATPEIYTLSLHDALPI